METVALKDYQRRKGISARKELDSDTVREYSMIIAQKIACSPMYFNAKTIFSYQPFGGEVDVSFLNQKALCDGKKLAFPICHGEGNMLAAIPAGPDAWQTGMYKIKEPLEELSLILEPDEIGLVIAPCAAFDGARRMRVGMGAGYYDRYLPKCTNSINIAVAYEAQHIPDICTDTWDVPLDAIVTEKRWY